VTVEVLVVPMARLQKVRVFVDSRFCMSTCFEYPIYRILIP